MDTAKCVLELSPSPKSPSARQPSKQSKDDTTKGKTSSHSVPQCKWFFFMTFKSTNCCTEHQCSAAPELVLSFLSYTEMVNKVSAMVPSHVSASCPSPPLSAVSMNLSSTSIFYIFFTYPSDLRSLI